MNTEVEIACFGTERAVIEAVIFGTGIESKFFGIPTSQCFRISRMDRDCSNILKSGVGFFCFGPGNCSDHEKQRANDPFRHKKPPQSFVTSRYERICFVRPTMELTGWTALYQPFKSG